MERKIRSTFVLLTLLLVFTVQGATAQEEQPHRIKATGHWIQGEFYTYYYANPNFQEVYGNPITESITEEGTGLVVQYFEYARFEYYPENPIGHRVKLSPIGSRLYEHGKYIPGLSKDTPNCHQADNWDYPVCYSFYPFYLQLGGEEQMGVPVSGMELLRGRLVQFFEFGKLEWHPDNPADSQVVLAALGYTYFFNMGGDYGDLQPPEPGDLGYRELIDDVSVVAFPEKAIISNGDLQVLNIIVKDHNNVPLSKADLNITVKFPDGKETPIDKYVTTDTHGLAQVTFIANSAMTGTVEVIVQVTFNVSVKDTTVTSFRLWY